MARQRIEAKHYLALALEAQAEGRHDDAHVLTQKTAELLDQAIALGELNRHLTPASAASDQRRTGAAVIPFKLKACDKVA